jgi:threonine/homoserine/homoserine lactone efflux protein
MTESSLLLFSLSTALLLGMPGPTNVLLASAGAAGGLRDAARLISAELAGYAISLTLLLSVDELAGAQRGDIGLALRTAATAVLVATAFKIWRNAGLAEKTRMDIGMPAAGHVFFLTLSNPKALILAFALFPPVIEHSGLILPALFCAGIIVATGLGWMGIGAAARRLPGRPQVGMARLSSLVIAGFACYFAATVAIELITPATA